MFSGIEMICTSEYHILLNFLSFSFGLYTCSIVCVLALSLFFQLSVNLISVVNAICCSVSISCSDVIFPLQR